MCDTLVAVGAHGTLFAKNSDRPAGESQVFEAFSARPAGGSVRAQYLELTDAGSVALAGSRPTWLWGLEHGVNAHRVAIGNEKLWTEADPRSAPPALIGMDLVRLGLERARDADEALDVITALLATVGQGGAAEADPPTPYFSSFLLADPTRAWLLETSGSTWAARAVGPGRGIAISNRITLRDDWTRASVDVEPGADFDRYRRRASPTAHADRRLAVTTPVVAGGADTCSARDLVATLRDHGTGPWGRPGAPGGGGAATPPPASAPSPTGVTVCMHLRGDQVTNASMVAELPLDPDAPLRAWVAPGSPCASVFVPVFPPGAVPVELADLATWAAFQALRPIIEGPTGAEALAAVRAALAPVEAELWDEADTCAEPGRDRERAALAASAWPRVATALRQLDMAG